MSKRTLFLKLGAILLCAAVLLSCTGCFSAGYLFGYGRGDDEDDWELEERDDRDDDDDDDDDYDDDVIDNVELPLFEGVTDAYTEKADYSDYGGNASTAEFHIPQIELEGAQIDALNQRIYDEWYTDVQYSLQNIRDYGSPSISTLSYEWWLNDDILTLIIEAVYPLDDDFVLHNVYNVSLADACEVSRSDLIEMCRIDEDAFYRVAEQALGSAFYDKVYPYKDDVFYNESAESYYQQTISRENIDRSAVYLGRNGHLCLLGEGFWPIGGGSFECDIDLEDYDISPYYGEALDTTPAATESTAAATHKSGITEDEAYRIACDNWDFHEGATVTSEGIEYKLYLSANGTATGSDGTMYYHFLLRWLTPDGILSTIDWLYVNSETGACSYSIP